MSAAQPRRTAHPASAPEPSQVSLKWLLSALGLLVLAALCCAYLSFCLLFLQGQWQLLYQPGGRSSDGHAHAASPADEGLPFSELRFGPNEATASELSGWWIPSGSATQAGMTVLYLHDGSGSLSDSSGETLADVARLHTLGCSVLAFDYRGFGASATGPPSEAGMIEDARRALLYLTGTRHLSASSIILWGRGIGATIAAEAADQQSPELRLVMQDANQPALVLLRADPRTRLLPLRLLLRDHLDAGPSLGRSVQKKLFLEQQKQDGHGGTSRDQMLDVPTWRLYAMAAEPKQLVLPTNEPAVRAFLFP